jgi:hypothetical protein
MGKILKLELIVLYLFAEVHFPDLSETKLKVTIADPAPSQILLYTVQNTK